MRHFFLILCFIAACTEVWSQPVREFYKRYTTDDGLSSNSCQVLLEDRQGYLWIGGSEGLDRYDGHQFKHYIHIPADSNSICGNTIRALAEDKEGIIWIGTYGEGISKYNPYTGSFEHIKFKANLQDQTRDNRISDIAVLSDGAIVVATDLGFHYLKPGEKKFLSADQKFRFPYPLNAAPCALRYDEKNQLLWLRYNNALFIWDEKNNTVYSSEHNPKGLQVFAHNPVGLPVSDSSGMIWYYDEESLSLIALNYSTGGINRFPIPAAHAAFVPTKIHYNAVSHSVILSYWSVHPLNFSISDNRFNQKPFTTEYPGNLGELMVWDALTAARGIQWYASNKGLFAHSKDQSSSNLYVLPSEAKITDLALVNDTVFACTQHGIYAFSNEDAPRLLFSTPEDRPFTFLEYLHDTGELLAATKTEIVTLNRKTFRTTTFLSFTNTHYFSRKENSIQFILFDSKKRYWIGTWGGNLVVTHDPAHEPIKQFSSLINADQWPGVGLISIHEHQDEIYIGFNAGLGVWKFREQDLLFEPFITNEIYSNLNGVIDALEVASDGKFLLGTHGGGLACIDAQQKTASYTSRINGLPGEYVYRILPVNDSTYLINTNNGIALMSYPDLNIRTMNNSFRQDFPLFTFSGADDGQGRFWFFYKNYIRSFIPVASDSAPLKPFITEVQINDQIIKDHNQSLSLKWNSGILSIWFTSFPFLSENLVEYSYSINNGHEWISNGNLNFIRLSNLSPGNYTILLKSRIANGKWTEPQAFNLMIQPPFWRTWWFVILAGAVVLGGFIAIYRYRINQILKLQRIRNNISGDLHDDIGATLSSIRIYSKVATDQLHSSPETASHMLEKISEDATQVMENMSDIVWSINPGNDTLESLVNRIKIHSIDVLQSIGISFKFEMNILRDIALNMRARKNIYLVIKEAINNIAKHSGAKTAETAINIRGNSLHIDIRDDGNFSPEVSGKGGNGMRNMRTRIEELNGSFSAQKNETGGLTISIILPITRISDSK